MVISILPWKPEGRYEEPWNDVLKGGAVKDLGSIYPDSTGWWYQLTIKGDLERGIGVVVRI